MKKVVKSSVETVGLDQVNGSKVYAVIRRGVIYKAHSVKEGYRFISMEDSGSGWESAETLEALIESELTNGVYEFESLCEFCKWILK